MKKLLILFMVLVATSVYSQSLEFDIPFSNEMLISDMTEEGGAYHTEYFSVTNVGSDSPCTIEVVMLEEHSPWFLTWCNEGSSVFNAGCHPSTIPFTIENWPANETLQMDIQLNGYDQTEGNLKFQFKYTLGLQEPIIQEFNIVSATANANDAVMPIMSLGNYPNPFNPETTISYSIKDNGNVSLDVFNLLGQKVTTLVNENQKAGEHSVVWNGTDSSGKNVSSGVYFYRLNTQGMTKTEKMVLMK